MKDIEKLLDYDTLKRYERGLNHRPATIKYDCLNCGNQVTSEYSLAPDGIELEGIVVCHACKVVLLVKEKICKDSVYYFDSED